MFTIMSFTFNPFAENTCVLHNETGDCIIVDPGCYFGNERLELAGYIAENGLRPKYLLNTHCHLDHIFGNKFIHETWQLQPWLHELDKLILDNAPAAGLRWGVPIDPYSGPVHFLREGAFIGLGADRLKVLFAPGHSPGHICLYCEEQGFVIGGDVLFKLGIGRTDLPGSDAPTLLKSIRQQLFVLPEETLVYPGHGGPTTIGFEKANNPYLRS